MNISLIVSSSMSFLNQIDTPYFSYDSPEDLNVEEGVGRALYREFLIKHPQVDLFLSHMGEENTFYLSRVFLSYYEAFQKLNDFWDKYACPNEKNIHPNITIEQLEKLTRELNYRPHNLNGLYYANDLEIEINWNRKDKISIEKNPFQEYLWAANMNRFLDEYKLGLYPDIIITKNSIFETSYLFKLALNKKEVSMALYEWANINSFNQSDFIKRISNVLEIIDNDLERHKELYDKITKRRDIYEGVCNLNHSVQNSWRPYFFGVFNASNLLGSYSRHASSEIAEIYGINTINDVLSMKRIVNVWKERALLPTNEQFDHLFKGWYLATSILLLNWLRVTHVSLDNKIV